MYFLDTLNEKGTMIFGTIKKQTEGKHAFHIHETDDLGGDSTCQNTGGHFNPYNEVAGMKVGDSLGSINSIKGEAKFFFSDDLVELSARKHISVLDRSIVLHETETGGPRVACCAIKQASVSEVWKKYRKAKKVKAAKCVFEDGGKVYFLEYEGQQGTKIFGNIAGLTDGRHAIHIHENGDLGGDSKCQNTGGHFNPYDAEPGLKVGDSLGNIDSLNQLANVMIHDDEVELNASPDISVMGRSIVVHARASDDPNGAGPRVACCTIKKTWGKPVKEAFEGLN